MAKLKRKTPAPKTEAPVRAVLPPLPPSEVKSEGCDIGPEVLAACINPCKEVPVATKIDWNARFDAAVARVKARRDAALASWGDGEKPPVDPKTIVDSTVISGKTVAEWDAMDDIPYEGGWASWAVRHWRAMGKPTPATKTLDKITKLREQAEEQVKFAQLDKDKAAKTGDKVKAKKLLAAAQKKSDKAAALFAEADQIAADHKKE